MSRPNALGRGLSALLGDAAPPAGELDDGAMRPQQTLPVGALQPNPDQPRRHFEESALDELAASIAERGLIQPIVVRPHGAGYQIVAGERRWRAAQRARLHDVPVVVRAFDDSETLQIALLENIQRQDLNAIEEAQAYRRLTDEFNYTQEVLAHHVHKSRSHVANLLRLLDLPSAVQDLIVAGTLSMGHARALLGAVEVEHLAEQVIAKGLSVRETEKLVRAEKRRVETKRTSPPRDTSDADISALEGQLADMLGLSVGIAHGDTGGTLTLGYSTLDQLDMLCQRLSGETL